MLYPHYVQYVHYVDELHILADYMRDCMRYAVGEIGELGT